MEMGGEWGLTRRCALHHQSVTGLLATKTARGDFTMPHPAPSFALDGPNWTDDSLHDV
ncbi:uncharacterized protein RCO7_14144 [Rhynchosporium graminicola]|uniref:Uncharacterized protein n=1 Tax=Rhynchosporium graminicola TaxID=2792576 RepID=A0A1E1JTG3_9HELO|nr:uncharacterized protein RCO7_14144 [Rhynchosporium commune]